MEGGGQPGGEFHHPSRNSDTVTSNNNSSSNSSKKSAVVKRDSGETTLNSSKFDRGDENWPVSEPVRDFIVSRDNSLQVVDCQAMVDIIVKTLCHFKNGCTQQEIIRSIHMKLEPLDTVHILNALDYAVSKGQLRLHEGRYLPLTGRVAAPAPSRRPSSPVRKKPKLLTSDTKKSKSSGSKQAT